MNNIFHWIRTRIINTVLVGFVLEMKPENQFIRRRYYKALNKLDEIHHSSRRIDEENDDDSIRRAKRVFVAIRYLVLRANNGDTAMLRAYRVKVNRLFQMKAEFEEALRNGNSKTDELMDEQDRLHAELDAIDEQLFIHARHV